jgi:hypothetical protein
MECIMPELIDPQLSSLVGEAAREADFLEKTAKADTPDPDTPAADLESWLYLRRVLYGAMHFVDQVPACAESMKLYRALQRARVELGDPPSESAD